MFMHLLLPEPIWNFPGMQSKKEDHFPTPKPGHCFGRLWGMMNHWNESSSVAGRSRRFILLSPYSMSIVWIDKHVICHGKTQWTSICQRCIGYSVPTIFPQWNSKPYNVVTLQPVKCFWKPARHRRCCCYSSQRNRYPRDVVDTVAVLQGMGMSGCRPFFWRYLKMGRYI